MSEILARANLGGLIGTVMLPTLPAKREQFYSAMLTKYISLLSEATRQRITTLQQYFMSSGTVDPTTTWHNAVAAVAQSVRTPSYLLANGDAFLVMGGALLLAVGAAVLMQRSKGTRVAAC
jgi:DHA2 family multidrug resistance protein